LTSALVADTHVAVWYLLDDNRLSKAANSALDTATAAGDPIFVSAISLVELTYLVEKGRVPAAALQMLRSAMLDSNSSFEVAHLDLSVTDAVALIPRDAVPDLPDRVIAATALALKLPLVSRDRKIQAADLETIW
jgi:PIN domain nuclease of toxin-antitoxin system